MKLHESGDVAYLRYSLLFNVRAWPTGALAALLLLVIAGGGLFMLNMFAPMVIFRVLRIMLGSLGLSSDWIYWGARVPYFMGFAYVAWRVLTWLHQERLVVKNDALHAVLRRGLEVMAPYAVASSGVLSAHPAGGSLRLKMPDHQSLTLDVQLISPHALRKVNLPSYGDTPSISVQLASHVGGGAEDGGRARAF